MSYLRMLGLGGRGRAGAALFSTAVISGSSSAPNLRVMIPSAAAADSGLDGFGGVPAVRPLETLHNALSLRQLDGWLERVTAAPVLLTPAATPPHKQPSPTGSMGWSGPSSLMSSSGELPSGLSSDGPSSPNSNYAPDKINLSDSSNWSRAMAGKGWEDGPSALEHPTAGSCTTSGRATPASVASDPAAGHSNEATAGSLTDHDLLSAGEEDEETLSVDASSSPMKLIKNDLTLEVEAASASATADPPPHLYGLSYHETKENFYKDMPTSSKNYNVETDKNKCTKDRLHFTSNINSLNLSRDIKCKDEILNNGSRRYSDSVAQKNNLIHVAGSRFKTSVVTEEILRSSAPPENCEHDPEPRGFSDMP